MWVKLRVRKNIKHKGILYHYKPGEWVEIGRQTAEQWLESGVAELAAEKRGAAGLDATCGIVVVGNLSETVRNRLTGITGLDVVYVPRDWQPDIPFTETLIYKPDFEPRLDNVLVGFKLLKKWQLAVPLWDYDTLALTQGSEQERQRTKDVIRDLRVPLRDTRLIFVKRCDLTRAMFAEWREALASGDDERLSFLRVLYQHKPIVCDLPAQWTGRVSD